MNPCIAAREVLIVLRQKKRRRLFRLAVPRTWKKATLLRYVRKVHPNDTVRILFWGPDHNDFGAIPLWIPDPEGWRA